METKIPGICAHHAIITKDCREVERPGLSPAREAFREAIRRLEEEFMLTVHHRGPQDEWVGHLVLTIEEAPGDD